MNVTTIGIDLAKNSFSLHGTDEHGKVVFRKTLPRHKLLPFLAQQPCCHIGMEACSGAHYWAREARKLGHVPGIMAPRFVAPYRKSGKTTAMTPKPSARPSAGPICASSRSRPPTSRPTSPCTEFAPS